MSGKTDHFDTQAIAVKTEEDDNDENVMPSAMSCYLILSIKQKHLATYA